MTITIRDITARDIRFPTSKNLDGSDAMNPDPDYSAAYVTIHTDSDDGLEGHGLTFTIGRGNELCVAAVDSLKPLLVGRTLESCTSDLGAFWRHMTGDSQLRWVGPDKGVVHMATGAVVRDLYAKAEGKPVWQVLVEMTPEELVGCIDFRYLTDALTPDEALEILKRNESTKADRIAEMKQRGYPSYTTSAGWLGYPDDKLRSLCRSLKERGWTHFKIKVGRDLDDDIRRCRIIREEIGWDRRLMMDANQVWDVGQAIEWMNALVEFKPWFIEEPTSPDDVLGHAAIAKGIAPIKVATGEMCQNRIVFKQLMQAGGLQICQIDSCRTGGVNEVLSVILMAAKFGIPVCPHAGGIGLCEYVQHLALFDYIAVSASLEDRLTEYSDHLHEHMATPVTMKHGCYMPPTDPGYSITIRPESLDEFEYPGGAAWQ